MALVASRKMRARRRVCNDRRSDNDSRPIGLPTTSILDAWEGLQTMTLQSLRSVQLQAGRQPSGPVSVEQTTFGTWMDHGKQTRCIRVRYRTPFRYCYDRICPEGNGVSASVSAEAPVQLPVCLTALSPEAARSLATHEVVRYPSPDSTPY